MGAAAVRDAIAAKIAAIAGVNVVYANGTTNAAIAPWPAEISGRDVPLCLLKRGPTTRTAGTSREEYVRQFSGDFYLSLVEPGMADRWVDELDDGLLAAFRVGITLGGIVQECRYTGSDEPALRTEAAGDIESLYMVWRTHFTTRETSSAGYTA